MERKCFYVNDLNVFILKIILNISFFRLQTNLLTLPGDILMVSAFVSYVGYFTKMYRHELIQNSWLPFFNEVKVRLLSK